MKVDVNVKFKNQILFLNFKSQYDMCSSLIRLQEFYESSYENIKGNVFELEDYMDTEAEEEGSFDYFDQVLGCNIPSDVIRLFFKKFSGKLRDKEKFLYGLLKTLVPDFEEIDCKKFYLIAAFKDFKEDDMDIVVKHEYCHALFYLNDDFRKEMTEAVEQIPEDFKNDFELVLYELNYHPDVITDEFQAFLATSPPVELIKEYMEMDGEKSGWKTKEVKNIQKPFIDIYEKYKLK